MNEAFKQGAGNFKLRLPATSANLGPGFDAAAVALDFYLEIQAAPAPVFSIIASGRDHERCASVENNLIIELYKGILREHGKPLVPLAIRMDNGIPLGMGCGSSAAGRLAAIAMAVHFGQLGWSSHRILEEACMLEGHPDNAAACWLGGFVAAALQGSTVQVAQVAPPAQWRSIIVLPSEPLATSEARAMLPESYSRADVVSNIQSAAMLGLAFAQGRGDLLPVAMRDRIHQPYRASSCPMLPRLMPLAGGQGILGVALSGAGPAVFVIVEDEKSIAHASTVIRDALKGLPEPELMICRFVQEGASQFVDSRQD
jgi:homoserine kinase